MRRLARPPTSTVPPPPRCSGAFGVRAATARDPAPLARAIPQAAEHRRTTKRCRAGLTQRIATVILLVTEQGLAHEAICGWWRKPPGSERVPRAGFGVPPKRTSCGVRSDGARSPHSTRGEVRDGGTPSPARGTRALPGKCADARPGDAAFSLSFPSRSQSQRSALGTDRAAAKLRRGHPPIPARRLRYWQPFQTMSDPRPARSDERSTAGRR